MKKENFCPMQEKFIVTQSLKVEYKMESVGDGS